MKKSTKEISSKRFKYLKYIPKPIHLDESRYDLVDDDEFFKRDNRMPLIMFTQFGVFPTKGHYSDKPKKDIIILEGLENQYIAFFRRTYLTNNEENGLVILYADEELVEDQKKFVSYINRKIKK